MATTELASTRSDGTPHENDDLLATLSTEAIADSEADPTADFASLNAESALLATLPRPEVAEDIAPCKAVPTPDAAEEAADDAAEAAFCKADAMPGLADEGSGPPGFGNSELILIGEAEAEADVGTVALGVGMVDVGPGSWLVIGWTGPNTPGMPGVVPGWLLVRDDI